MKTLVICLSAALLCIGTSARAAENTQSRAPNDAFVDAASVIWFDLMVGDTQRAKAFYADVFGWQFVDQGGDYTVIQADGKGIGGLSHRKATGEQNGVSIYFPVANLDATLAKAKANGATVILEPMPIPGGLGTMTLFGDLDGNPVGLIQAEGN